MASRWLIPVALFAAAVAWPQDAREIVRRSIAEDQLDWVRMKDYTWRAQSLEKHLDPHGKVQSEKRETWETLILDGEPYRRTLEKDGRPLSPQEQGKEQKKLDDAARKLTSQSPAERQRRLEEAEKRRRHEFEFLSEIPELFDLKLEGEATVGGRPVWIVSGAPRPGAKPRSSDAKVLLKIRGRMWIDQATYQWVKVEAQTTAVISWGLFLARLNPGASLAFEQAQVGDLWFPKRLVMSGSGRVGLIKRLSQEEEVDWSDYKKFSVDSKVLTEAPPPPK
jgi:hypothetical protein